MKLGINLKEEKSKFIKHSDGVVVVMMVIIMVVVVIVAGLVYGKYIVYMYAKIAVAIIIIINRI